jgi:hypothetical protein
MEILAQFLLRLTFGLAFGMAITSPQKVPSGFFRNHLYVTLGLTTLAALVTFAATREAFWYAVGAAVASYVGSVCWLYEKNRAGIIALFVVAMFSLESTWALPDQLATSDKVADRYFAAIPADGTADEFTARYSKVASALWIWSGFWRALSNVSSGLLLGTTLTAMFLGHWYLNSPTMELAPLRRLLVAMGAALILQIVVSAVGLVCELNFAGDVSMHWLLFVVLRWSFGLVGVGALAWMTWQMLKIPNTQSATGTLYVAVIGVFVGELTAALLSSESMFPL